MDTPFPSPPAPGTAEADKVIADIWREVNQRHRLSDVCRAEAVDLFASALRDAHARLAATEAILQRSVDWWLENGINHFNGAPEWVFAARTRVSKGPNDASNPNP